MSFYSNTPGSAFCYRTEGVMRQATLFAGPVRSFAALLAVSALFTGCTPLRPMQVNIPNGGRAVALAVHPTDDTHIIAASETGGLFRSTNRGADWTQVSGATSFWFADVLYVPGSPNTVVGAAANDMRATSGGGIWRSTNGGASWTRATITPPTTACTQDLAGYAVAVETGTPRLWAGTLCGLSYSNDSGATWQYLSSSSGYSNDKTYAVLAPAANQLKILTDFGVKVSSDGGSSWTVSNTGLPGNIIKGVHNQIAASPFDNTHLYWAFNYWQWDAGASKWRGHAALYRSTNNGSSWSSVVDETDVINRPPMVRVTAATGPNAYAIYFSDGSCTLERASVTQGSPPTISSWSPLGIDHCDPADLAFDTDKHTPLLLASDGGLHKTTDGGATWTLTGAGGHGYAALQITEVTGQIDDTAPDLYFGTQDNDIWASNDDGATWTGQRCCEGFFLNIWRDQLPPANTKLTGVSCGACGNFVSEPVLASQAGWPDPPNNNGNPRLLKPQYYIQNTAVPGLTGNIFDVTTDTGGSWTPRYGFPEDVRDLSKVSGDTSDPTVFTAVRRTGSTPDGQEILGIKRITGVTANGTPVLSDVSGFGSLGIFATMFAWYKPFGVDPENPNNFIVADIIDNAVKKSTDAGASWTPDATLTSLITASGNLRFRSGPFTQLSAYGYDPTCPGHVMVGTIQAGIFQTFDNGATWTKVRDSEIVPNVGSFFFHRMGQAVVSSYGRGLWTVDYSCPKKPLRPHGLQLAEPTIYWKGGRIPISQIHNPDACPVCTFVLVQGGRILDFIVDEKTGKVQEITLSGGEVKQFNWERDEVPLEVHTSRGQRLGTFGGDKTLVSYLQENGVQIKGLMLEKGVLKGVILSQVDVSPQQLPAKREAAAPRIELNIPSTEGKGIPVGSGDGIVIHGFQFERGAPIEVLLDGEPVKLDKQPEVDEKGSFTVTAPPILNIGGHTILVRQRTTHGVLQDAFTFHVTVQDLPRRP